MLHKAILNKINHLPSFLNFFYIELCNVIIYIILHKILDKFKRIIKR